jgi:ABC-2 type transport system permease protein
MLFTFGIGLAIERGRKFDVLMRATPLRPIVQLGAKLVSGLVFALLALAVLFAFALITGLRMDAGNWLALTWRLLLGSIPFLLLGFAIGYLVSPNAAPAVVNLIALPMYFASGLFVPIAALPDFVQKIAPYLPAYRYGQLAWDAVGAPSSDSLLVNALWLLGYSVAFLAITLWAYRLDDSRKFS